jgi:DNA-directed RNA polymerase subunit alpha
VEDVTEIILNLKQVRFKKQIEDTDRESVNVSVSGQGQLTAGDLQKFISGFQVLNTDLVICNMEESVKIDMELSIEKGRGFVPAEENKKSNAPLGTIFTDSIYTPIKNVKYAVENYRVEQKTDYEKLVFDIKTDGSINPKAALTEAAKILIHHFMLFSDERITLEADERAQTETYDEESLHMRQLLKTKLIDMDLSVRALNCLKAAEVETLGDLVSYNKNDLMKFRNFGKKSLTELDELVNSKGLSFGMDLSKYKLDKE